MTDASHGPPQEGQIAPDFELPSATGEKVRLLEMMGKCIVLVFFPITFATYSTMEIRAFVDKHIALQSLGATVIGVSVEPPEALRTFSEREEIPFILVSDFEREAAKAYGVFAKELDNFRSVALPSVFVVNKKQKIIYRWVADEVDKFPDLDQVLGVIKGFDASDDFC